MTRRLYLAGAGPGEVALDAAARHYLARVLRLSAGDALEVFDGAGRAYEAVLGPEGASVTIGVERARPAGVDVTLLQGLPKGDKLELVLQKATELGVARVWPVICERSVSRPDAERRESRAARWRKVAEEAARQCGRADVPRVDAPSPLRDALAEPRRDGEARLVLDPRANAPLSAYGDAERFTLLVGPEGGLSDAELELARDAGFVGVTLGPRVLRTETVALAALAVLAHLKGELG